MALTRFSGMTTRVRLPGISHTLRGTSISTLYVICSNQEEEKDDRYHAPSHLFREGPEALDGLAEDPVFVLGGEEVHFVAHQFKRLAIGEPVA